MTVTVCIVIPTLNAAATIDRTIASVLTQAGDFRIRCHVQDCGSSDGTLERLAWWQDRGVGSQAPVCRAIRFTWGSEPADGCHDALVRGFAVPALEPTSFMTWLVAGDMLMPGALALAAGMERQFTPAELSWFGGMACLLQDTMMVESYEEPVPTEVLRLGLCDGTHWEAPQQAGIFFRKWLWEAVEPAQHIAPLQAMGAERLWQQMAERTGFAQIATPLAASRDPAPQLPDETPDHSANWRADPQRAAFEAFCRTGPALRYGLRRVQGPVCEVFEEAADPLVRERYRRVLGVPPPWAEHRPAPGRVIARGRPPVGEPTAPETPVDPPLLLQHGPRSLALDEGWQFPAITEQHAWRRICDRAGHIPQGAFYVGYPWATLIDKLLKQTADRHLHLDRFERFCTGLPAGGVKVTVCQHIHAAHFPWLFRQAGIGTVFWSHATRADLASPPQADLHFRPFPLYPVQLPEPRPPEAHSLPRALLFSFIGARANQYYLTRSRDWILDLLGSDPRGLVIGRDSWHYQRVVYDLQIRDLARSSPPADFEDAAAARQFRDVLAQSTFALCPSGSGPNSIRLWESLGAGAIPVILADTWAPPGDPQLWQRAAVFCAETPEAVAALPDRLAALAADPVRLAGMQQAMRQLWSLYGPQSFIPDVLAFLHSTVTPESTSVTQGADRLSNGVATAKIMS